MIIAPSDHHVTADDHLVHTYMHLSTTIAALNYHSTLNYFGKLQKLVSNHCHHHHLLMTLMMMMTERYPLMEAQCPR